MKKFITYLSVAALSAGLLAGCGKQEEKSRLARLETKEYVTLGQYTGFEASEVMVTITEEEVDNQLGYLLNNLDEQQDMAELKEITDRAVRNWDKTFIDFEGKLDGVAFEGGTSTNYELVIGSGSFINGFEEGLIGAGLGETIDLELTFPAGYQVAELAGQDVVFTVTVNKIQEYQLTDEIAQKINTETLTAEELRQSVYDALHDKAVRSYDLSIQTQLLDQIAAGCEWKQDVPEEIVQSYLSRIKDNLNQIAQLSNITLEQLLNYQFGIQESQFEASFKESAILGAKEDIILQAIANEQGLNPTQQEIDAVRTEGMEKGGYNNLNAYKEAVGEEYYTQNIRDYLMADKVTAYLKENSVITEQTAETAPEETESSTQDENETETAEEPEETGTAAETVSEAGGE